MVKSVIQFDTPALVPAEPQANTTQVLLDRVRETPNYALFSLPVDGGWKDVTSTEFLEQVVALAKGFIASGIKQGDRTVIGGNGNPLTSLVNGHRPDTGRQRQLFKRLKRGQCQLAELPFFSQQQPLPLW